MVGAIVPWNFPMSMACWKLAPALATGNTVVLKPAEETSLSTLRLAELIQEAGFPDGVVNVVTGTGPAAGAAIAGHAGIDKVAFTGSTNVGRLVARAATGNLKKVSLELGETEMGPLVSATQLARVAGYLASGHDEGAKLVTGGGRPAGLGEEYRDGYFLEPTIFVETDHSMRVVREEIFGPVLVVMEWEDVDDLVAMANDTCYGLSAGIWTQNLTMAHRIAAAIRAGTKRKRVGEPHVKQRSGKGPSWISNFAGGAPLSPAARSASARPSRANWYAKASRW